MQQEEQLFRPHWGEVEYMSEEMGKLCEEIFQSTVWKGMCAHQCDMTSNLKSGDFILRFVTGILCTPYTHQISQEPEDSCAKC